MAIDELPTEILTHIFLRCETVASVLALASTCRHLHNVFRSSKRLTILHQAAEQEYGPLHDLIQVTTFNSSQPAHLVRSVPTSEALLEVVLRMGRIAVRWEEIYPFKKWKSDFANRRLLCRTERRIFRRALYRLWLYTHAFHNQAHPRLLRATPTSMQERAMLLHNFSTVELAEMLDVHNTLRHVIGDNICPSNGAISRKFSRRFPDSSHQLLFNIHLNYPVQPGFVTSDAYFTHHRPHSDLAHSKFHNKYIPSRYHEPGGEGWGDDVLHYYVVEDMLKLDPGQILWLRDNAPLKSQVEVYTRRIGDWFENNGETFCQTTAHVVGQRGGDWDRVKAMVEDGCWGIGTWEEEP